MYNGDTYGNLMVETLKSFFLQLKPIHKGEAEIETQEAIAEAENKASNSNTSVKKASPSTAAVNSTEKPRGMYSEFCLYLRKLKRLPRIKKYSFFFLM